MRTVGIRRQLRLALENVERDIANTAKSNPQYSRGASHDGYAGGYRQALHNVVEAMNGRRLFYSPYWPSPEAAKPRPLKSQR